MARETRLAGCVTGALIAGVAMIMLPAAARAQAAAAKAADRCVRADGGFRQDGSRAMFRVDLENSCAQRMRCVVHVAVNTAMGSATGRKTLTLGTPVTSGKPARKRRTVLPPKASYDLPLKQSVGSAHYSRTCTAL